jgi:hypothetical protein
MLAAKITHIEHQVRRPLSRWLCWPDVRPTDVRRACSPQLQHTGLSGELLKGTRNWLDDRPYRHQLDLNAKNMKPYMTAARLADSSKVRIRLRMSSLV